MAGTPFKLRPKRHNVAYSCAGKGRWKSEDGAQRALTLMRQDGRGSWDHSVRPYRCSHCKRWHLGHET